MGGTWRNNVRELLRDLDVAQHDLSALQDRKRTALVNGESEQLLSLSQEEATLGNRLRDLLQRRTRILDDARAAGAPQVATLANLVAQLPSEDRADLEPLIDQAKRRAKRIRSETWVQWIIAHRAHSHYSSMLELIAESGQTSPTYESQPSQESTGGAIFDASI